MKVYVAGCGAVCAAGENIKKILETFDNGYVSPAKTRILDTEIDYPVFEVPEIKNRKNKQRTFTLLEHALFEAIGDSKLIEQDLQNYKTGICFGTTVACQLNNLEFYSEYKNTGNLQISAINNFLNGNLSAEVKKMLSLKGPHLTIVNACTSGTDAVGTAALWIKSGFCDIAIAGGADEINKIPLSGFGSLNNISEEKCCPFDKNRKGLNIGEGAGVIILVSQKIVDELNLKPEIEFSAYSTATDAYHLTAPSPEGRGLIKAINNAMNFSKISCFEIGFINAHGTATKDNDLVESKVFKSIFGNNVRFLSTKGFTGHTLGAAGALEAIFTIYGLKEKWIPGSSEFKDYDEETGISPVTRKTSIECEYAMSASLAFGGNNSVLIFKRK